MNSIYIYYKKYVYKNCIPLIILLCLLSFLYIIYYYYTYPKKGKEGFTWNKQTQEDFLKYQQTVFPNAYQFDLQMLQQQASEEDVQYLLKNDHWKWSDQTKYLFMDNVSRNTMIKILPQEALTTAMKIYNENVMKKILSLKDKEGQILLYGVLTGHGKNMPENVQNSIQCVNTDVNNDNYYMEKIEYNGFNLWNGYKNGTVTKVNNEDLPKEIPGFEFIKGPCNPCTALKNPADNSCPFSLNVDGNNEVSPLWKDFWKL